MPRFIKWVRNSWLGEWWRVGCHHYNKQGEVCMRIDCHPGSCKTYNGVKFYSGDS